ncbi:phage tail protein [Mesorhizobium muleiense]|uniref:phage tail protein n=1 Tax=Mesorhizobium muleiense TaxID=1004279 RepID=UPI003AFAB321
MSCVPDKATFRLLDAYVGWDAFVSEHLTGFDDDAGVKLAQLAQQTGAAVVSIALPPARLARDCSQCQWYLVTCCPPQSRLLELNSCTKGWRPILKGRCKPDFLVCATAIAVHRDRIAVSDRGAGRVWVWRRGGAELAFSIPMPHPGPLAWAPWHEWLIADLAASVLRRFDPSGAERGTPIALPGTADRLSVDRACRIWLVTRDEGAYRIWSAMRGEEFAAASIEDLLQAFPDTGLRRVGEHYFCIEDEADGETRQRCFDCHGRPATPSPPVVQPLYETRGQLLTLAIDSGIPRCRWHRVRIDADVPPGTTVSLAVSAHEEEKPASQGTVIELEWQGFAVGLPHPEDWNQGPQGALDFIIDQPPGRYLFARLRLTGDGLRTPTVRRVRFDFPRQTSFDRLPAVYHDNPTADDFGERFLALFDAAIEDIDRIIERYPALLDVEGVPSELLPWIGGFLDVAVDPAWTPAQRRSILKAIPDLYLKRGTPEGLRRALELVLGVEPAIQELAVERPWGAVGQSRLDGIRLFGQSAARVRLGRSRLSGTPLWSVGNPDLDAVNSNAYRFRVMLPALASAELREQAARVVEALKPAHTVAGLHQGGVGIVVGIGSSVGIDTALVPLPPPVLGGTAGVRLNRSSVLWAANDSSDTPIQVGRASAIGIHTIME